MLRGSETSIPRALAILLSAGTLVIGCSNRADDYYPLDSGRWWYFETQMKILDTVQQQRLMVANVGTGVYAGESAFIQRQPSGREVYIRETDRGIERVGTRAAIGTTEEAEAPILILPADPVPGASWHSTTMLALIESRTFARQDQLRPTALPLEIEMSVAAVDETITVPAGSFEHCLRIDGSGRRSVRTDRGNASAEVVVAQQEWYAPGVGLVKLERSETSDSPFLKAGHYVQELVQYD